MARKYTKGKGLTEVIRAGKAKGETKRGIGASCGLSKTQVKRLMTRQNRQERRSPEGYIPRPKGRLHKEPANDEVKRCNEVVQLRMQVELLRNFLSEDGMR